MNTEPQETSFKTNPESSLWPVFVTATKGIETLLKDELAGFGLSELRETVGGVSGQGDLAALMRTCLWSRLGSRVLLPLTRFALHEDDAIYQAASSLDWQQIFDKHNSFAVEFAGKSRIITHGQWAALRVKDAVVDQFRQRTGVRPNVDTHQPDIQLHLHLDGDHATISLDLSGESLHRRGYRLSGVEAPIKENLAAALVLRSGWQVGQPMVDGFCGSGTVLIEAAMIASDIAPNLQRQHWGFLHWQEHQPKLWRELREEAHARIRASESTFYGFDLDKTALKAAAANAERAGVHIEWGSSDATQLAPPCEEVGVWVSNPPYGERLGDEGEMIKLYSLLGANLVKQWHGWQVSLLGARADLMPRLGLRADKIWSLYNGALACKLMRFPVPDTVFTGGDDFANRLAKNYKHLNKWAKRNGVNAYRVYDADMPEFAVAVDVYDVGERHVVVQEYAPPKTVDPIAAEKRLRQALAHIQSVLELNGEQLHFKRREAQKGTQQYQRQGEDGKYHVVVEQDCKLYVNFEDYLDTGLFLDHRPLRQRLQREAAGKRFLNLYCYTGAATIHAATGGAESTVSVDLSNTYLDWLQQNLLLNGFVSPNSSPLTVRVNAGSRLVPHAKGQPHHLIRADVLEWLARAEDEGWVFDLIFCDPPTFSNSKKMQGIFDVQRDHVELIERAAALLSKDGVLYFSCNRRGFKLGELFQLQAQEITRETVDEDFKRPPPPHKAWRITRA